MDRSEISGNGVSCQLRGTSYPVGSMYGIFTYMCLIFMVNVGKYTVHGSYGYTEFFVSGRFFFRLLKQYVFARCMMHGCWMGR